MDKAVWLCALMIVDSFGARGVTDRRGSEFRPPVDRVMDVYGALTFRSGDVLAICFAVASLAFAATVVLARTSPTIQ